MTKKNYTHITLLVDRSGSMISIQPDAQGGINEFIAQHKAAPGQCTFALYEFDTEFNAAYGPGNISMVEGYTLVPRGGTALYDSQMRAINETGNYLESLPEDQRPEKVIFLTVTDGGENMSHEFVGPKGAAAVKQKVQHQEHTYNWEFIYIGANQDAFAVGSSLGITRTTAYASTGQSVAAMYGNVTSSTLNARSTGADTSATLASAVASDGTLDFDRKKKENEQTTDGDSQ